MQASVLPQPDGSVFLTDGGVETDPAELGSFWVVESRSGS